jgi:hypothetical protein
MPCDGRCKGCDNVFLSLAKYKHHQCDQGKQLSLAQIELEKFKMEQEKIRMEQEKFRMEQETKRKELDLKLTQEQQLTKRKEIEFKTEKLKLKLKVAETQPKNRHEQMLIPLSDFNAQYVKGTYHPLNINTKIQHEINVTFDAAGNENIEMIERFERRSQYARTAEMAISPEIKRKTIECCVYNLDDLISDNLLDLIRMIHTEKDKPRLHAIQYRDPQLMKTFERPDEETKWIDVPPEQTQKKLEEHSKNIVLFILESVKTKLVPGLVPMYEPPINPKKQVPYVPGLVLPLDETQSLILIENRRQDTEIIVEQISSHLIKECPEHHHEDIKWLFMVFNERKDKLTKTMSNAKFNPENVSKFLKLCKPNEV